MALRCEFRKHVYMHFVFSPRTRRCPPAHTALVVNLRLWFLWQRMKTSCEERANERERKLVWSQKSVWMLSLPINTQLATPLSHTNSNSYPLEDSASLPLIPLVMTLSIRTACQILKWCFIQTMYFFIPLSTFSWVSAEIRSIFWLLFWCFSYLVSSLKMAIAPRSENSFFLLVPTQLGSTLFLVFPLGGSIWCQILF